MPGFVLASPNTEDIQMFMKILDMIGLFIHFYLNVEKKVK